MYHIQTANLTDIPELKQLYKEVILSVNRKDYSASEVEDWASCGDNDSPWVQLLTEHHLIMVKNESEKIVGFSSINRDGYLHMMFVHKDFQRLGIAKLLYNSIENYAINNNIRTITSEVSITARPFFERQGFAVDEEQKRKAKNLYLTNYKMSKKI
ncbi:MAG: GNAT family N-acetyltransferase [Dysgonomonas sp.]